MVLRSSAPQACGLRAAHPRATRPTRCAAPAAAAAEPAAPPAAAETRTQRAFRELDARGSGGAQAGGAGGGTTYAALRRADAAWLDMRTRTAFGPRPDFVRATEAPLPARPGLDVAVAGGTLGIFLAAALQAAGLRVAVVEAGPLAGRAQEWNCSRAELAELVKAGALSAADAEAGIAAEFNPVCVAVAGGPEVWTRDVLNLGVAPARLVAAARARFEAAGGLVVERAPLTAVWVHPNGVQLRLAGDGAGGDGGDGERALAARLLIDVMGNGSPIARQARHGRRPDGVCAVVGSCARGFDPSLNVTGSASRSRKRPRNQPTNQPTNQPLITNPLPKTKSQATSSSRSRIPSRRAPAPRPLPRHPPPSPPLTPSSRSPTASSSSRPSRPAPAPATARPTCSPTSTRTPRAPRSRRSSRRELQEGSTGVPDLASR
jgi:hypothetical protein